MMRALHISNLKAQHVSYSYVLLDHHLLEFPHMICCVRKVASMALEMLAEVGGRNFSKRFSDLDG